MAAQLSWRDRLAFLPKLVLAAILILSILDLLAGVVLRYAVVEITDYFDWPPVSFFWVEEVGEFSLAWLTLIGAALAIVERTHFSLTVFVHRFPRHLRGVIDRLNHLLIAGFGVLAAGYGWRLSEINATLRSPGLEINLAWLYFSAVIGGGLIAIYGFAVACGILRLRDFHDPTGAA